MDDETKKMFEQHESRIKALEDRFQKEQINTSASKAVSIKEFMILKKPKNDLEKTLAIGYFLEKHQRLANFTSSELVSGFGSAKEPSPTNISDMIAKNIKKGLMMEATGKKEGKRAYNLTSSGEKFVEDSFP